MAEFKMRIVLEAIKGIDTINEIAAKYFCGISDERVKISSATIGERINAT